MIKFKIFAESCRLAENDKKNWASSIKAYLNYLKSNLGVRFSIPDKHFLQYYQAIRSNRSLPICMAETDESC